MTTFADMATLLMAFFVLLLAFSEMDIVKYKAVSGSMKRALGVKVDSTDISLPKGDPSPIPEIRGSDAPDPGKPDGSHEKDKDKQHSQEAMLVKQKLSEEIKEKKILLDEGLPGKLIIRLPEQGVFPSGSDEISQAFVPTLAKIRAVLADVQGNIYVAGHTDDRPISNKRFRSNWDLSAGRAVSVVHVLLKGGKVTSDRVVAQGYAESRPLVPNTDKTSRAKNRRVDIILQTARREGPKPADLPEGDAPEEGELEEADP